MNICKECKWINEQNSLCPIHWKCQCKAKWKPLRDPVTGDDRSGFDRVPLCCDTNKDGTCTGFERRKTPHEQYDEWRETQANAERYKAALEKIAAPVSYAACKMSARMQQDARDALEGKP